MYIWTNFLLSEKHYEVGNTLKARAVVSQTTDSVQNKVDDFLSNCVVATSVIIGSIFFASYHLLRMEELFVRASTDFI